MRFKKEESFYMKYHDLIRRMTIEEKCYLLSGKDFWQTRSVERLGVPNMTLSDGPHGIRKQVGAGDQLGLNPSLPATCYPTAATIANSWDPALGEEIGEHLGTEAASQGVGVLLGPGLNIKRSPFCGRNFEYFSEDPYLAGKMAASYVRGIQKNGLPQALCRQLPGAAAHGLRLRHGRADAPRNLSDRVRDCGEGGQGPLHHVLL